ncbi:MAG: hypothetical protein JO150_13885 [Acidobacteriaceae bacterium]|nr:hypothetical protein [Acidobacteriaceae bacterium]
MGEFIVRLPEEVEKMIEERTGSRLDARNLRAILFFGIAENVENKDFQISALLAHHPEFTVEKLPSQPEQQLSPRHVTSTPEGTTWSEKLTRFFGYTEEELMRKLDWNFSGPVNVEGPKEPGTKPRAMAETLDC